MSNKKLSKLGLLVSFTAILLSVIVPICFMTYRINITEFYGFSYIVLLLVLFSAAVYSYFSDIKVKTLISNNIPPALCGVIAAISLILGFVSILVALPQELTDIANKDVIGLVPDLIVLPLILLLLGNIAGCFFFAFKHAVITPNDDSADYQKNTHFCTVQTKSKVLAILIALFFGGIGSHRYYLGYNKVGAIQTAGYVCAVVGISVQTQGYSSFAIAISLLLLIFAVVTGIWVLIDFVKICIGSLQPANGLTYREDLTNARVEDIEKLAQLLEQGIISEDEFTRKKADILKRL